MICQNLYLIIIGCLFGFNSLFATTLTIDIQKDSINQTSEIFFFTNRPYKKTKKGIQFKNKWKGYGLQIHFAAYNPNTDQYRLIQSLQYFEEDREELSERFWNQKEALNIIYKEILDSKKFDRVAIFIPGYSKTFEGQIKQFIPKLKSNYEGQAQNKTLFLTFAWGDEWRFGRYFAGKRSAKRAAIDYSIFHLLLQKWHQQNSITSSTMPPIDLICLSMGNQVLETFLRITSYYKVDLNPIYNKIFLVGCDVRWDSFEKASRFKSMHKITPEVNLFVNRKDFPLLLSSVLNCRKRLGRRGLKNPALKPSYLKTFNISRLMSDIDGKGLYHDYFFSNKYVQKYMQKFFIRNEG